MMSRRGVDAAQAKALVTRLRPIAAAPSRRCASHRKRLAEAEYDRRQYQAVAGRRRGRAARSIPASVQALVYKGRALTELAAEGDKAPALPRRARPSRGEQDRPRRSRAAALYYRSFLREGNGRPPMPSPRFIMPPSLPRRTRACVTSDQTTTCVADS